MGERLSRDIFPMGNSIPGPSFRGGESLNGPVFPGGKYARGGGGLMLQQRSVLWRTKTFWWRVLVRKKMQANNVHYVILQRDNF